MPDVSASTKQYFATLDGKPLAAELLQRVHDYDRHVDQTGRWSVWARCYAFYHQAIYQDARLNRTGEQGEYTEISVNHFRNILTHMLVMTTNQRPSFDAKAANSNFKSQAQAIVANGILEYYDRFKGMDEIAKQAVEDCLIFADAYVYEGWDYSLGQPLMPDMKTGTIQKTGDVLFKNFTPMDVIFDVKGGLRDAARQWYVIRDFQNKWDLAARYPEKADKIIGNTDDANRVKYAGMRAFKADSDFVPVYIFVHDRTDAVPDGRFFTFMNENIQLVDAALPPFYKSLPVKRLCASKQRATGFGYSIAFDLAPIQEAVNGLHSIVITNQSAFGVQNIMVPTGGNISVSELADGLKVIKYNSQYPPPQALNLVSTPREIFDYIEVLESVMQTISGVNSVARGNPEESLKSGTALALVQSMAIQFMSGLQQSHARLLEDLGTGLINILQANATTPRLIEIAGKNNKSYVKEFTNKDIADISRVTVDLGNPIARTLAGKVNMAENLIKANLIEDASQYIQVLTTGKLEPLIEGKQAELMLIRSENEALADGKQIQATAIDSHHLHIMEHRCVIASPEAREDPNVVQSVVAHIQQHIDLWKQTDPSLLQMIGEPLPPPPPLPVPGLPSGEPGPGAPPAGGPTTASPGAAPELIQSDPTVAKAAKVRPAGLPKNPLTKEAATLNGGIH